MQRSVRGLCVNCWLRLNYIIPNTLRRRFDSLGINPIATRIAQSSVNKRRTQTAYITAIAKSMAPTAW